MGESLAMSEAEIGDFLREHLLPAEPQALVAVWLYGSAARGELRPGSDVDLAFLAARPVEPLRRFEVAQELAERLHRDVDLVDMSRVPTVLRSQVVGHGRRIMTADLAQAEKFEMFVLCDYARLGEERHEVLASFKERYGV